MKIKLISLSSSRVRRDEIGEQLRKVGAPFEFSEAITPENALRDVHHYDEKEFVLNCGRVATGQEISRYASHLALWKRCAEGTDPYLILEDDAELDELFVEGLMAVASQISRYGLIRVSLPETLRSRIIADSGDFKIEYCRHAEALSIGYAVSPEAAAGLASAGAVIEESVDQYVRRFWRHGQPVYAMHQAIVSHSPVATSHRINRRMRHPLGLVTWLRRAARRADNAIARARFNLLYDFDLMASD
jgi:glycosyl transferase family 25